MSTQVNRNIPAYTQGTISGVSGAQAIVGIGTNWTTTDGLGNVVAVVYPGDLLVVAGLPFPNPILSIDSDTGITLELPLPSGLLNAGYRILRYTPSPQGTVLGAVQQLLAAGTDISPKTAWTVDSGAVRAKLRGNSSGQAEIAVGPTGAVDSALVPAVKFSATGKATFSTPIDPASLTGLRVNLLAFGSAPDADGTWTSTITAAEAGTATRILVPSGIYATTATNVFKVYEGPGLIKLGVTSTGTSFSGGNTQARTRSAITARPSTTGTYADRATYFNDDFTHNISSSFVQVYDSDTANPVMGKPTAYTYTPTTSAHFTSYDYASGWNQSTSNQTGGRTGAAIYDVRGAMGGQGDLTAYFAVLDVYSTRSMQSDGLAATHFLANPAISIFGGQVSADASGVGAYLQAGEVHFVAANEAAMIGWTMDFARGSNATALGATVQAFRGQTSGTYGGDAVVVAAGSWNHGLDTVTATLTNAVNMAAGQKLTFDSSTVNVAGQPALVGNVQGTTYVQKNGASLILVVNNSTSLQLTNTGAIVPGTFYVAGAVTFATALTAANGGTGDTGGAWTAYTPTVTAPGSSGFAATGSMRYLKVGRKVTLTGSISITAAGTGGSYVQATLPFLAAALSVGCGRANAVSAKMLQAIVQTSIQACTINNYDGGYPAANGENLIFTLEYEATS